MVLVGKTFFRPSSPCHQFWWLAIAMLAIPFTLSSHAHSHLWCRHCVPFCIPYPTFATHTCTPPYLYSSNTCANKPNLFVSLVRIRFAKAHRTSQNWWAPSRNSRIDSKRCTLPNPNHSVAFPRDRPRILSRLASLVWEPSGVSWPIGSIGPTRSCRPWTITTRRLLWPGNSVWSIMIPHMPESS